MRKMNSMNLIFQNEEKHLKLVMTLTNSRKMVSIIPFVITAGKKFSGVIQSKLLAC